MRDYLREARLMAKLSMKEMGDKLDISESYYCLLESGKRNMPVDVAKRIEQALNIPWTRFYEDEQK